MQDHSVYYGKSEDVHIPNELKLPIAVGNEIAGAYEDIASLEAISEYFRRLYYYKGESLDQKKNYRSV